VIRNTWSAAPSVSGRQSVRRSQARQAKPWPPPGFCQAAPVFACSVRFVQNHWPALEKLCTACTESQ
jgi:hypothetical protein